MSKKNSKKLTLIGSEGILLVIKTCVNELTEFERGKEVGCLSEISNDGEEDETVAGSKVGVSGNESKV